jgi:4-amino-4-deoxy-L-arabinose transferase-like glycosyltransferase
MPPADRVSPRRGFPVGAVLVFLLSYCILFLGMTRHPYIYDEGLVLTAAMRVAAGQIPHRDFYANYAPAQFYILAGLFKLFGNSLLVERLFDLLIKALVVTLVYAIVASVSRRWIAACTALVTILWLVGLHDLPGTHRSCLSLCSI